MRGWVRGRPNPARRWRPDMFWAKVEKTDTCWLWKGAVSRPGWHGRSMGPRQRIEMAHRIAYELLVGPIPPGLYALHHCDTPLCVNPSHLFLGTIRDNTQDMYRKGRDRNANRERQTCQYGHPLDYIAPASGKRGCRTCRSNARREQTLRDELRRNAVEKLGRMVG